MRDWARPVRGRPVIDVVPSYAARWGRTMLAAERVEQRVDLMADGVSEPPSPPASNAVEPDDAALDDWIGSLTTDQFERVLTSLARVLGRDDGGAHPPDEPDNLRSALSTSCRPC